MQYRRGVFRMELRTDIPTLIGDLNNLHKVRGRVDTHTLHALRLIFRLIGIVELIAMAMTFLYQRILTIGLTSSQS